MVGGGRYVVYVVFVGMWLGVGHVRGVVVWACVCGKCIWTVWLCCFGDADMGGLRCDVLVLLGAFWASMYGRSVSDDGVSPFDSCSGMGSGAVRLRLRLPVCVVCVW